MFVLFEFYFLMRMKIRDFVIILLRIWIEDPNWYDHIYYLNTVNFMYGHILTDLC